MAIKRSWEDDREVENLAMANCLMLLSRVGQSDPQSDRVFHCKTCNKQFKSFQALGGHRASHKRPKSSAEQSEADQSAAPPKPKSHECSVCGLEFAIGQALGGHMRRHRDGGSEKSGRPEVARRAEAAPEKRGLCLDLNLTPYENDMKVWNSSVKTALAI